MTPAEALEQVRKVRDSIASASRNGDFGLTGWRDDLTAILDAVTPDQGTVDIVFDGPPSAESGRFVEVESPPGTSIKYGDWVHREDGFWALRIPATPEPAPVMVETVEQLEALPVGAVIGSRLAGGEWSVATKNRKEDALEDYDWSIDGQAGRYSNHGVEEHLGLPATVLTPAPASPLANDREALDPVRIANLAQESLGRGVMPSTVRAVLDAIEEAR